MSKIIYASLIRLPQSVETAQEAVELISNHVNIPHTIKSIPSNFVLIDNTHINILRYFEDISEYKQWVFSKERNSADEILIEKGFYLYTKQAHL